MVYNIGLWTTIRVIEGSTKIEPREGIEKEKKKNRRKEVQNGWEQAGAATGHVWESKQVEDHSWKLMALLEVGKGMEKRCF